VDRRGRRRRRPRPRAALSRGERSPSRRGGPARVQGTGPGSATHFGRPVIVRVTTRP
jgi:hypothetical protein